MSGRVVHFEVPFEDQERASSFYSEVFGWQLQSLPEMSYVMVTTGPTGDQGATEPGFINGGMVERGGAFITPDVVIDVENLENALKTVNEHGGTTVSERQPVGEMGFTAYCKDSESEADQRRHHGYDEALGEHLPDDAQASSTQRYADLEFALSRSSA